MIRHVTFGYLIHDELLSYLLITDAMNTRKKERHACIRVFCKNNKHVITRHCRFTYIGLVNSICRKNHANYSQRNDINEVYKNDYAV